MDYKLLYECEMKRADKAEDELAALRARVAKLNSIVEINLVESNISPYMHALVNGQLFARALINGTVYEPLPVPPEWKGI
jgi:hypothetical protein